MDRPDRDSWRRQPHLPAAVALARMAGYEGGRLNRDEYEELVRYARHCGASEWEMYCAARARRRW